LGTANIKQTIFPKQTFFKQMHDLTTSPGYNCKSHLHKSCNPKLTTRWLHCMDCPRYRADNYTAS